VQLRGFAGEGGAGPRDHHFRATAPRGSAPSRAVSKARARDHDGCEDVDEGGVCRPIQMRPTRAAA